MPPFSFPPPSSVHLSSNKNHMAPVARTLRARLPRGYSSRHPATRVVATLAPKFLPASVRSSATSFFRTRASSPQEASTSASEPSAITTTTASDNDDAEKVVRRMYRKINKRDVNAAMECVDDDIVYEDLNFPTPFQGADAVRKLFEESCDGIPADLDFVIDECTSGDPLCVGMTWHVELGGKTFPNARGCSFYRISPTTGRLVYARDIVENPTKLGSTAFAIMRAVLPLVRKQIGAADAPSTESDVKNIERTITPAAVAFGLAGAAYWYILLLSPPFSMMPSAALLPGEPMWAVAPDTLSEVVAESTDFFFVLPLLNNLGINFMQAPDVHPVSLGFFNACEAYALLLLPLLLRQAKKRGTSTNVLPVWSAAMFLTNAILLPYFAVAKSEEGTASSDDGSNAPLSPAAERAFGIGGLAVGALSVYWTLAANPELGGSLADRASYWSSLVALDPSGGGSRVTIAFLVDAALFYAWQVWLMGELADEKPEKQTSVLRFVPFAGLALWLL